MRDGTALTHIPEFSGKEYKAGEKIPGKVLANVSPQVLKALVDNFKIEIEGMEPSGGGSGAQQHLMARLDQQGETIKKLEARIAVLEGGKPAAEKKPTAKKADKADKAKA